MKENWVYRRGGVLQNDTGNRHSPTLSVVKLTSKVKKKPNQPTHYTLKNVRGIPYPSQVLAEQPDTINKSDIIRYMAHLSDKHMEAISRCLEVELGMDTEHELPASRCVKTIKGKRAGQPGTLQSVKELL